MNEKPPPDYAPNGAHYAVIPSAILGSMDARREDFWQTTVSADEARRRAVEAAEDLALEHGGEWIAWSIDPARGSWGMLHRFGTGTAAAAPKATTGTATAAAPSPRPAASAAPSKAAAAPSLFGGR